MAASTRRQAVAEGGGLFSTAKPTFSKDTQDLLKLMMQESKLTNFQQRKLRESMMSGQALPAQCAPTSSGPHSGKQTHRASNSAKKKKEPDQVKGLRSRETILKLSANDSSLSYRPPPQKYDGVREKERLQNVMTYGRTQPDSEVTTKSARKDSETELQERDRFEEVLDEIEERRQFLADMEALGQGKEHYSKIMTEISQRVRELEVIDKKRTAELKLLD